MRRNKHVGTCGPSIMNLNAIIADVCNLDDEAFCNQLTKYLNGSNVCGKTLDGLTVATELATMLASPVFICRLAMYKHNNDLVRCCFLQFASITHNILSSLPRDRRHRVEPSIKGFLTALANAIFTVYTMSDKILIGRSNGITRDVGVIKDRIHEAGLSRYGFYQLIELAEKNTPFLYNLAEDELNADIGA